jgi:hypothetical protein
VDPKEPYLKTLAMSVPNAIPLLQLRSITQQFRLLSRLADFFSAKEKPSPCHPLKIAEIGWKPQLLRVLAHRLEQLRFTIWLDTSPRAGDRPEDPQSFRDPARSLEKMGRHDEAVPCTKRWR